MAPLVACAAQQTACGELLCGQQGNSADCTPLNSSSGYRQVAPGVPCDADSQCHDGGCVPAGSLSPCKNGQPANACGGCGTLPGTWDTPCDDGCGRLRCHSTNANALTCIPGLCAAEWLVGAFGACSQACGGGTHTRSVTCVDGETSQPVDEGHCSAPKPAESESCNTFACHDWAPGEWSGCTAACAGGTQTREVPCVSYLGVTVDDALCVTPPPATGQSCNTFACPGWLPGEWSACSVSCGGGTQSRAVPCVDALGAAVEASACATAPPPTSQSCNTVACPAWRTGAWSQCSEVCGDGTQSRSVDCAGDAGATVADAQCPAPKPAATQTCRLEACPNWQTGEWSTCPSDCGGNSTREVRCVDAAGDPTEDERCPVPRPNTEQPCDAQRCGESCGGCASTGGLGELLLGLALLALRRRR